MRLAAPWYTYQKKVKALFDLDADIEVGDVRQDEDGNYAFEILVHNSAKFIALDRVMPKIVGFDNVMLKINIVDVEDDSTLAAIELYKTIFENNPIVKDVRDIRDDMGMLHGYVRFQPEVLQFFNDDLSDFNGLWSGLAQEIAKEVFTNQNVHFCTADLRENGNAVCEPLGEWP